MEIIVLCGIQACGKSTFYEKKFKDTHVRVNLDTLKTRKAEDDLIKKCIEENKSFVIDNTNVTKKERKKYIDIAKENGYKIINYNIYVEKNIAIERNSKREGKAKIPPVAIYSALKRFEKVSLDEGFDEIYCIDNTNNDYKLI